MTEPEIAAAVKVVVDRWMQSTPPAQRHIEMANPATLSALLGLSVQQSLVLAGHRPAALRGHMLQAPFSHLRGVFDPSWLVDTPTAFCPVPETVGTIAGRAAALAVHGVLQLETVSYGTENSGNLFVNLVAIPGSGAFAEKSRKSLRGHTDGVSFPFNGEDDPQDSRLAPAPDLVTLVGLRNPNDIPTKVMSLADVLGSLSPSDVAELKKSQYSIRSQKTFVQDMKRILGREHVVIDGPILKDFLGRTYIRYSHSNVVPSASGGPAEQASNNLEAVCNQIAVSVVVQPGDLLVINNRLSLHGRGVVGDEVGGQSRWLLRTYGLDTSNLPAHKRHVGGTPPHVLFP
jgi:hypothetical protein